MNEKIEVPTMKVPPLKKICMTIGQLPASYVESMSYYEMLVWFVHYLRDDIIPVVNANGEATKELQELYVELQDYVNNYFDNLDVQEEINNKLDEMAESGQLTDIIAQYLGLAGMITFNSVSEMKLAENLVNGSKCSTLGYYNINDGGNATYKIRTITNDDVVDEMFIIALYDNTLVAELIIDNPLNIKQIGAKGDNYNDDSSIINAAISKTKNIYIPNGTYLINNVINLPDNVTIIGENINNTLITKSSETTPNAVFNITETGKIKLNNFKIDCNSLVDYGILSNVTISKFEISDINIYNPLTAGVYTNKSTYLGIIKNVKIFNTNGHGFYLVPINKNSYTNTSINLINCYTSECNNGYAIDGSYMNMENCACDGAYHIAYDLRGYIGTLVSCGSESYYCDYMFYGDHFTNVTIINPQTFASYDKENSVHIYTGSSSTWVFIGGRLALPYRTENPTGLGKFLEQSNDSHIKFIGTEVRGTFTKPSTIIEGSEISDYKGSVNTKGDILYLGYNDTSFGDEISSKLLPSSGIYLGVNNQPYISKNTKIQSRNVHTGDLFISKTPSKINGAGWISNTDYNGLIVNGSYYKIPIVQNGETSAVPRRGLVVGDMYFDTTINMPKWCTSIGRQQDETLKFSTPPVTAGNITITFDGVGYTIPVTANMTNDELYAALINANIEGLIFEKYTSSVRCLNKDYKGGYGGNSMLTINVGDTGAVMSQSVAVNGSNPTWKSLAEFINP